MDAERRDGTSEVRDDVGKRIRVMGAGWAWHLLTDNCRRSMHSTSNAGGKNMMRMKTSHAKLAAILLAPVLSLCALSGCASDDETSGDVAPLTIASTTTPLDTSGRCPSPPPMCYDPMADGISRFYRATCYREEASYSPASCVCSCYSML